VLIGRSISVKGFRACLDAIESNRRDPEAPLRKRPRWKRELRGIVIGNAKDGSLKAFIPDPGDLDKVDVGSSASGIAADDAGTVCAADVGTHGLRKYLKVR
jgi:hypothetical protein